MRTPARTAAVLAALAVAVVGGCGSGSGSDGGRNLVPTSRHALLHPSQKYFGVSVPGAPASFDGVTTVSKQLHKSPDVVEYFQDWTHPFDVGAAQSACDAGVLPALTWESWSWEDRTDNQTTITQPAYAPSQIAAGVYDGYIRRTAEQIKSLGCPIMVRFDQEPNGHWYPWGLATPGMSNTAQEYVAMWRHVWGIFHAVGVSNVIWVWSPNVLYRHGVNQLAALYPGARYVDAVGIDGYLLLPTDTFSGIFRSTLQQLRRVAGGKPWLISETGVASGQAQPSQLTSLLHLVATSPRLIGLIYFDVDATRANWTLDASSASLQAFRTGISAPAYGAALGAGL